MSETLAHLRWYIVAAIGSILFLILLLRDRRTAAQWRENTNKAIERSAEREETIGNLQRETNSLLKEILTELRQRKP